MDKLPKARHQMMIEEVYKIKERFSLNSCFPHIFPLRLVPVLTTNTLNLLLPCRVRDLPKKEFKGEIRRLLNILVQKVGLAY